MGGMEHHGAYMNGINAALELAAAHHADLASPDGHWQHPEDASDAPLALLLNIEQEEENA